MLPQSKFYLKSLNSDKLKEWEISEQKVTKRGKMKILTGTGTCVFILRTAPSFWFRLLKVCLGIHFLQFAFSEVTLSRDSIHLLSLYTLLSCVLFVW